MNPYFFPTFSSTFQLPSNQYITLDDDGSIFNELLQQEHIFSDDHSNHSANNNAIHQQSLASDHDNIRASFQPAMGQCSNTNGGIGINKPITSNSKRRRGSNKDRHSKINTAQGPRDRRMRLSLDVSKKFFKLQDMLGFDKASKTVEWLLMKSKSNIQELVLDGRSSFSGSICEVLSEYIDDNQNAKSSSSTSTRKANKKTSKEVRKSAYLQRPLAKETRELARKRARERTLEKSSKFSCVSGGDDQFSKFRPCLDQIIEREVNRLSPWNQPEQLDAHFHLKQGVIDDNSSSMIGGWNPSFLFNYQQTGVHPQEHQFNDFETLGNLWEVKN
ncbi:hypothetical protein QVD17_39040 [Tagetes erecta]|uniref:Cycloidea-like protein n=1 Tax=Tagetes erecta TaxID=13708 RepID=A0AAD8JMV6_TARER|nr:hypothetical protein QVD17_39040 [Tagetes erecta]